MPTTTLERKKNRRKRKSVCDIAKGKEKTSKKCGENKR